MDKVVIAEVNADVRRAVSVGAEENEVARNEIACGNGRAVIVLDICGAWNGDTGVGEDVLDITRAVETVRTGSAENVRNADIVHGGSDNTTSNVIRAARYFGHLSA